MEVGTLAGVPQRNPLVEALDCAAPGDGEVPGGLRGATGPVAPEPARNALDQQSLASNGKILAAATADDERGARALFRQTHVALGVKAAGEEVTRRPAAATHRQRVALGDCSRRNCA